MKPADCIFVEPSIGFMPSFHEAVLEGYQIRTAGPDFSEEELNDIQNLPQDWLNTFLNPPQQILLPDGGTVDRVPGTSLWFVHDKDFIGTINIRHHLNKVLMKNGGHIGYSVRPKYWGQGFATKMLSHALQFCGAELGLEKALVTCDEINPASARVIEKNGGQLENIIPNPYFKDRMVKRYWVPTS